MRKVVELTDPVTAEEYLKHQRSGPHEFAPKYEFFDQKLRLLSGNNHNHNAIVTNFVYEISLQTHQNDMDIHVFAVYLRTISYSTTKNYVYPDIIIVEGKVYCEDGSDDNLVNPTLIIEILSDSTEGFDRGDKFGSYRQTPSIKEYILVSQKEKCIEQFFKDEAGRWQIGEIIIEGTFKLETIPFELSVEDIYRNVEFKPLPSVSEEDKV